MVSKRISITLPPELLEAVDEAAQAEQRSRSGLMRTALLQYLEQPMLPEHLIDLIEDYFEVNDPEAIRDIEISSCEVREGKVVDPEELSRKLRAVADQSSS